MSPRTVNYQNVGVEPKFIENLSNPNMSIPLNVADGITTMRKFGRALAIPVDSNFHDVWEQVDEYTFLTEGKALQISSSSASDTGTTIHVFGLDADGYLQDEVVALNGRTAVNLVGTYLRVFRAHTENDTAFVGDVYVTPQTADLTDGVPDTDSEILIKILANNQQTVMAIYTVPKDYVGLFVRGIISMNTTVAAARTIVGYLRTRELGGSFLVKGTAELASQGDSIYEEVFEPYYRLPELTDVKISVSDSSANTTNVSAKFTVILIPKKLVPDLNYS